MAAAPSPKIPRPPRLFFALWPEEPLRTRLEALARQEVPVDRGRRIPAENLHLTLAFLGHVPAEARTCLERSASAIRGEPFTLVLDRLDCFRRTGVLWVGASQVPAPLATLVHALDAAAAGCGLAPQRREFRAHVTVARKLRRCPPPRPIAPLEWPVGHFCLALSNTHPAGARYEILRSWELR